MPTSIRFTETMKGYASRGQLAFEDGYQQGKAAGETLLFELTITVDDVDRFCSDPAHGARCEGFVESTLVGGRCTVEQGTFQLFVAGPGDRNRREMRYRLFFHDSQGRALTLTGTKHVQDQVGFDVWQDTTTLHVYLLEGHVERDQDPQASVVAAGILHIHFGDFLRQLSTFRAFGPDRAARIAGFARFGQFFLGSLWDTYGAYLRPGHETFQREIPLFTTEGVRGAEVRVHPFLTGDKLGLSLLRFQRAPSREVVVIVHGLTTSSDMFIMPEHNNLVSFLLDHGFTDVWTLDFRMSNRHPYNLQRHRYTMDDIALFDYPAALAEVRRHVPGDANIHVISHCLGAVSFAMSVFGKAVDGVRSAIANSAALTPRVPGWSRWKLRFAPFLTEYILGTPYLNPRWSEEPGLTVGKIFTRVNSAFHRECDVPACHMLSLMWGTGWPALYSHENLADVTHRRGGDLYGGTSMHYYRHVQKMVASNNTAVKYDPRNARHATLPDDYFQHAAAIETPFLFTTGGDNHVFTDSNVECHRRLDRIAPGRHSLRVFPRYGHQDVFMGKNVDRDVFPSFLEFLRRQGRSAPLAVGDGGSAGPREPLAPQAAPQSAHF